MCRLKYGINNFTFNYMINNDLANIKINYCGNISWEWMPRNI